MNQEYIPVENFCRYHQIEITFLDSLHEHGLINMETENDDRFLLQDELPEIEKMIRFHYDMDINVEGIEAINHLLKEVNEMQQQISSLKNKLRIYEETH